jgi:hypothetical protein
MPLINPSAYDISILQLKHHLYQMTLEGAVEIVNLLKSFIDFIERHSDTLADLGTFERDNTIIACLRDIRNSFARNLDYLD